MDDSGWHLLDNNVTFNTSDSRTPGVSNFFLKIKNFVKSKEKLARSQITDEEISVKNIS